MAAGLTGAQTDTCFQVLDRLGALHQRRDALEARLEHLAATRAQAEALAPASGAEATDWYDNAMALVDQLREEMTTEAQESARAEHALMGVNLTFCRPASRP